MRKTLLLGICNFCVRTFLLLSNEFKIDTSLSSYLFILNKPRQSWSPIDFWQLVFVVLRFEYQSNLKTVWKHHVRFWRKKNCHCNWHLNKMVEFFIQKKQGSFSPNVPDKCQSFIWQVVKKVYWEVRLDQKFEWPTLKKIRRLQLTKGGSSRNHVRLLEGVVIKSSFG